MRFELSKSGEASDPRPRFCPGCRMQAAADSDSLCPNCGDTFVAQAYCPTCEAYWCLPVGVDCPKHDLPLLEEPPRLELPFAPDERPNWTTVAAFSFPFQAEAARLRLDAEGIPTFLDGQRMATNYSHNLVTGGVRLQVPRRCVQEARVLLSQNWAAPFEDDLDDEDWDDVPTAPEPNWRASVLFWGTLLALLVVALGILGWTSG